MNATTQLALTNKEKAQEIFIALAKGGLSFVPGGGLVTEMCGVLIPDKQDERIMKMLIQVYEKVEDMDRSRVQERLKEPNFQELFHDCKYEAARTSAQVKLEGIANILVSGINPNANISHLKRMLNIFGRLDELDLLLLYAIGEKPIQHRNNKVSGKVEKSAIADIYITITHCIAVSRVLFKDFDEPMDSLSHAQMQSRNSLKKLENECLINVRENKIHEHEPDYTLNELGLTLFRIIKPEFFQSPPSKENQ